MENTKVTRKDRLNAILSLLTAIDADSAPGFDLPDLIAMVENDIATLDNRAAKAKERAAAKKADDPMLDAVYAVLTNEATLIDDITAKIDFEDVTKAKVQNRLAKLAKEGKAVKTEVSVEGSKSKRVAYALA